jgi:hypothetical protein
MSSPKRLKRGKLPLSQRADPDEEDDVADAVVVSMTTTTKPPAHNPQKTTKSTFVPRGLDTYPWGSEFVNIARADLGREAIWGMVTVLVLIIPFWAILWIPAVPDSVLRYGAIEYIILALLYLFNFLVSSFSTVNEFYRLGLLLNLAGFALEILLLVGLGFSFYNCIQGISPSSCTGNYVVDTLVSIASFILFCVGVVSVSNFLFIVRRTAAAVPPQYYLYRES